MLRPVLLYLLVLLDWPGLRTSFAGDARSVRSELDSRRVLILALYVRIETLPVALLDEVVHQLARAVVHLDVERLHLTREIVERHNGRDGNEKTERRRNQSLRNTAG